MSALSQAEAFARIRLLRSPRIGPVSFAQLLARYGSGEAAVEAAQEAWQPQKREPASGD